MRTFVALAFVAGAALWAARRTRGAEPQWRLVRAALYLTSGIFAALLVSAMLQALFALD